MVEMAYPRDDARFRDGNGDTGIDVVGDPDDPPVRDVPEDRVDHFQRYGWELVDDSDDGQVATDDQDEDAETSDDSDSESEDGFGNAAEGFDAESFVDRNVDPIADDLATGDYDNVLDAVEDAEKADGSPRNTVMDAIESRRGA